MLSQKRFNAVYNSLNGAAKKVYAAVPIAERWSVPQVLGELQRRGMSHEYRVVQACLALLVDHGLAKEPVRGQFIREPVRLATDLSERDVPLEEPMQQTVTTLKPDLCTKADPKQSPIDHLGMLAARVAGLGDVLKDLSREINDTVLELQEQLEGTAADTEKLRQLQTLLKSLA